MARSYGINKVRTRERGGVLPQTLEHEVAETRFHDHRPLATATAKLLSLEDEPSMDEMTEALLKRGCQVGKLSGQMVSRPNS